jgi:hypothetical protein
VPELARPVKAHSCYRECISYSLSVPRTALQPQFRAVAVLSGLPSRSWFQRVAAAPMGALLALLISVGSFLVLTGLAADLKSNPSTLTILAVALLGIIAFVFYILFFLTTVTTLYCSRLRNALLNAGRDASETEDRQRSSVASKRSDRDRTLNLGRRFASILSMPEQFALYQIAVLRGGIEISADSRPSRARTDGDLLPPGKLRLWNAESQNAA